MKNPNSGASAAEGASATGPTIEQTVNGIAVTTPGGRTPGEVGALAYVEGSRIQTVGLIQDIRGCWIGCIDELTSSIRSNGILEPLVVRPAGDGKNFELIAGERRLKAAKTVGGKAWEHVPVIIRLDLEGRDDKAIAVAVFKNSPDTGRSILRITDIGRQMLRLQKKGWDPEWIAVEMGLHVKRVRWALELDRLSEDIQERVRRDHFPLELARDLMGTFETRNLEPINEYESGTNDEAGSDDGS